MAKKSGRSRRLSFLAGFSLRAMLAGTAALMATGSEAQAEALRDWQYDEETRSLTVILPDSVTPLVSVIAPDQLLLELPDTQVGDVMGQNVQDGLVENIVLEQATPETVWVVMEFAAGTVLASSQNAVPLAETGSGDQQWQIRPALTAASRRAASQSVALATEGASASSLRTSAAEIAQAPDLSGLPVLEPAVPMSDPVSVPPLSQPVSVPPLEPALAEESVIEDPVAEEPMLEESVAVEVEEDSPTANETAFDVEVIPAEGTVAVEVEPVDDVQTAASNDGLLPAEPPFLETVEAAEEMSGPVSEPVFVELEVVEPEVAESEVGDERVAEVDSDTSTEEPIAERSAEDRIASSDTSFTQELEPEAVEEPAPIETIEPSNVSRWPEPIPFGQPLPR